ncbi:heterokaryon incompatibility protein-domain-containing protein [Paraphoma chrysanthemicola]|nr:heterokaryon incompatibility protein-domain-containing protein [Paraphoma chrysanthemicola]
MPIMGPDMVCLIISAFIALIAHVIHRRHSKTTRSASTNAKSLHKAVHVSPHRHSCQYCRNISINLPSDITSPEFNFLLRLDLTFSEVTQPAVRDCPLLRDAHVTSTLPVNMRIYNHLQTFFDTFSSNSDLHLFTGCKTFSARFLYFVRGLSSRPYHVRFSRLHADSSGTLYARLLHTASRIFEFDVSVEPDDHAAQYIHERPLSVNVASQHTFDQAREWFFECTQDLDSHSECIHEQSVFTPTRLIHVLRQPDGTFATRIVQNMKGKRTKWATLSYCWGGDQPSKTTKANLRDRLISLPFPDLPQTIQDAIVVTTHLGLSFLWIDALCIVQDDENDVAHEIASMPEVYSHGACTISASRASSSEEGFLQAHQIDGIHHKPVALRVTCPDGIPGYVTLSSRGAEYRNAKEPVHGRAWCYQERILSPRILDFGHTQVQWICKSKRYADGGRVERAVTTDALLGNSLQNLSQRAIQDSWSNVIWKYTRRDMTFVGDRLLAVSAIATVFAPHLRCDYLAGHWRNLLSLQLAWIVGQPKYSRSNIFVAPSWSWASVSDMVYWDMQDERVPAVEVLDCQVQLQHTFAPFGAVTSGFLELRAQMQEMIWYFNRDDRQIQVEAHAFSCIANREKCETLPEYLNTVFQAYVSWDALETDWSKDPDASMKVWCLKLRERSQKGDTLCLFLVPADSVAGSFRRIAAFRIVDAIYRFNPPVSRDFFEGCEWQVVRIV